MLQRRAAEVAEKTQREVVLKRALRYLCDLCGSALKKPGEPGG